MSGKGQNDCGCGGNGKKQGTKQTNGKTEKK